MYYLFSDTSSLDTIVPRDVSFPFVCLFLLSNLQNFQKLPEDLKYGDLFVVNELGAYICCGRVPDQKTLYDFFEITPPSNITEEELVFTWPPTDQ